MVQLGFFNDNPSGRAVAGFDSASNGNQYQQYFLEDKGGRRLGLTTLPTSFADGHAIWEPQTP